MNNLIAFSFLICSLIKGKSENYVSNWKKIDSEYKVSTENHPFDKDSLCVPFIWQKFPTATFDSLADKGAIYDSIMTVHADSLDKYMPEPVGMEFPNAIVVYSRKQVVSIGNCKYEAHFFLINEGRIFIESNCFEFCYIKNFGIVSAIHLDTQLASVDYERYILTDLKRKDGQPAVNKKELKLIVDKVKKYKN